MDPRIKVRGCSVCVDFLSSDARHGQSLFCRWGGRRRPIRGWRWPLRPISLLLLLVSWFVALSIYLRLSLSLFSRHRERDVAAQFKLKNLHLIFMVLGILFILLLFFGGWRVGNRRQQHVTSRKIQKIFTKDSTQRSKSRHGLKVARPRLLFTL